MAVIGRDLKDGKPVNESPRMPGPSGVQLALFAAAYLALILGGLLWIVGAWYTVRGWIIGVNLVAAVVGIGGRLAEPVGWWLLSVLVIGAGYSLIEIYLRPRRAVYGRLLDKIGWRLLAILILLWFFVVLTDIGSTYLSVVTPGAGAWQLAVAIAATPWAAGLWTLVLTFFPEGLFLLGGALLKGARTWNM